MAAEWPDGEARPGAPRRCASAVRAGRQRRPLRRRRPAPDPAQHRARRPSGSSATATTTVDEMVHALAEAHRDAVIAGTPTPRRAAEDVRLTGAQAGRPGRSVVGAPGRYASCRPRGGLWRMGRAHRPPGPDASPDEVAAAVGRDGAVIVDGVAAAGAARPHRGRAASLPQRHADRARRLQREPHPADRVAHRPVAGVPRAGHAPARAGDGAHLPRARHEHPAAPDPGHRHRPGGDRPAHPPRPVGVRLLPLPAGLRGPVQHHLGADRLHRGERRHPGRAGQQPPRGQADLRPRRHRAGRDGARARCSSTRAACTTAAAPTAPTPPASG